MNLGVTITNELEGKVSCELAPNSINVEGRIRGEIKIFEGITLLTTRRFEFFVRNPLITDDVVESTTELPILMKLITKYDGMVIEQIAMVEAELEREVNEDNRKLLNQQLVQLQTNLVNLKDAVNATNNLVIDAENIRAGNEILRQDLKARVEVLQGDLELLITSATDTIDIVNQAATNANAKAVLADTAASNANSAVLTIQAVESAINTAEGLRVIDENIRKNK